MCFPHNSSLEMKRCFGTGRRFVREHAELGLLKSTPSFVPLVLLSSFDEMMAVTAGEIAQSKGLKEAHQIS